MGAYAARAAEAIEQQVRYWRMLQDPAYRAYASRKVARQRATGQTGAQVVNTLMDYVARAATAVGEPFWWSPQICSLIEAVAPSMPPYTLTRESLPSAGGFFWFAKPISNGKSTIKAIAWAQLLPEQDTDISKGGQLSAKAVSVRPHTLQQATAISATFFETDGEVYRVNPDPRYRRWEVPMAANVWKFGSPHTFQEDRDLADEADETGVHDAVFESQVFAACIAFLNQRILVSPRQQVERAARRRLEALRAPHEPLVRVVALRKAFERLSASDGAVGDPVAWSCHWMVGARTGGFWRNQAMKDGKHELRFILPHVKGDITKPFKPPTQTVGSVHR